MGKFLGFLALVVTSIPVALLKALVISWLWLWFLVPLGVPPVGVVHALGITYVVWAILAGVKTQDFKTEDSKWYTETISQLIFTLLASLVLWGFGYVVHLFM